MKKTLLVTLALFSSAALANGPGIHSASLSGSVHSTSASAMAEGAQLQADFEQDGKQRLAKYTNYYSGELVLANSIRVIGSDVGLKQTVDSNGMEAYQPVLQVQYRHRVVPPSQRD